jgi:Matrixin/Bacterial Ig domain
MRVKTLAGFMATTLIVSSASGQSALRLKTKQAVVSTDIPLAAALSTRTPERSHWIVQFPSAPGMSELTELDRRGIRVLSYVPDNGLSVVASGNTMWEGLEAQWIGQLEAQEKISPALRGELSAGGYSAAIVESYADVEPGDVRAIVNQSGAVIQENPDLLANHLLVWADSDQVLTMAGWDEIAYIFPASAELSIGSPVNACAGAFTSLGLVTQSVALIDDGWDGPGLGAADLKYSFVHVTGKAPTNTAESEIERALAEWSHYVMVNFAPSADPAGDRTLAILFASGAHGDGYPFNPGVIAHTFYPVPTNPEPIAGDMHFNEDQSWRIGANIDIYSVALHEAGHALGLGHSDTPASVMYPYYHMHTVLQAEDIAAIRQLYATRIDSGGSATPTPAPSNTLLLIVQAPASTTTASSIGLSGALSGGVGAVTLAWSTNQGFSGASQAGATWTIPAIPLNTGANVVTIVAKDSTQNVVTQSVTVTRQSAAEPPSDPRPLPPPGAPDTTPPSLTILSPASNTFSTPASSIIVSGTASDNVGVAKVTWTASSGALGTAAGTTNWTTPAIPLYVGATTIVVTASDAAGNTSWRSVVVTRN